MTETRSIGHEIQREVLSAVNKSEDALVDATKRWAKAVQSVMPSFPCPTCPTATSCPSPMSS